MNRLLKPALASAFAALLVGGVAIANPPEQPTDQTTLAATEQSADGAITEQVRAALAADSTLAGSSIQVKTTGGEVSLEGTVGNPAAAEKAAAIAKSVAGVKSVKNGLKSK